MDIGAAIAYFFVWIGSKDDDHYRRPREIMKIKFRLLKIFVILLLALSSCQLGRTEKTPTPPVTNEETEAAFSGATPTAMFQVISPTETRSTSNEPLGTIEPTITETQEDAPTALPTQTPTPTLAPTTASPAPPQPLIGAQLPPKTYRLRRGEFPWCIARRYDLNPNEMMRLNKFFFGQIFFSGQRIKLPQTGNPFPGNRALKPHPAIYVVKFGDTINKVACYYGDVEPIAIAHVNGLTPPYQLLVGQKLTIPEAGYFSGDGAVAPAIAQQPTKAPPTAAPTAPPSPTPLSTIPIPPTETPTVQPTISPTAQPTTPATKALMPTATPTLGPVVMISPDISVDSERNWNQFYNSVSLISLNPENVNPARTTETVSLNDLVGFFPEASVSPVTGCQSRTDFYHSPKLPELHQIIDLISCGWEEDEQVQVSITSPENEIVHAGVYKAKRHQYSPEIALVTLKYFSLIRGAPGIYAVEYHGEAGDRSILQSFELNKPQGPRVDVVVQDMPGLLVYNFQPGERVKIKVFRKSSEDPSVWEYVGYKDIVVDHRGIFRIQIVTDDVSIYGFQLIGETSGNATPTQ